MQSKSSIVDGLRALRILLLPFIVETRGGDNECRKQITNKHDLASSASLKSRRGNINLRDGRCALFDDLLATLKCTYRKVNTSGAFDRIESLWLSPNSEAPQMEIAA
jgi:hypothetical protein